MKRFLALALSLVMAISITACGNSGSGSGTGGGGKEYPSGNIDMAVGFKAGGGTYLSAQLLTN